MSQNEDKVFMRHFSMVIIFLIIITISIALFGGYLNGKLKPAENPSHQANIEKRIESPAAVYTGNEAPKPEVAPVTAPIAAAGGDDSASAAEPANIDGAGIFQRACFACHGTGAAGAPKLEKAAWESRIAQGEDTLVDHAIHGFNAMPAKGGQAQLSDAEIRATVQYMVSQAQ